MIQPKKMGDTEMLDTIKEEKLMSPVLAPDSFKMNRNDSSDASGSSGEERDLRYRSCEEVDSDELDGDLNLSGDEAMASSFRAKNKVSKAQARFRPAR